MSESPLIKLIAKVLPDITLIKSDSFYWSPKNKLITYNESSISTSSGQWALLHEAAHAKLDHTNYSSDLALLKMEVAAWEEAKKIGAKADIKIDEDHIQDCLDTYRDWLHRRSTCPNCNVICTQSDQSHYKCHNCATTWRVSNSRFCRPYRLRINNQNEKRPQPKVATFS